MALDDMVIFAEWLSYMALSALLASRGVEQQTRRASTSAGADMTLQMSEGISK